MSLEIKNPSFIKGARKKEDFIKGNAPEYAFYGKSNCGKSSLINMICQRKHLVHTGSRPGMTQEINFFDMDERFVLVDLPGVGYAKLPGETRKTLGHLISDYLEERKPLRMVFYLMDLRREPGEDELGTLEYLLEKSGRVVLVGTKADKLGSNDLVKTKKYWLNFFGIEEDQLIISSSQAAKGRQDILDYLEADLKTKKTVSKA